MMPSRVSTHTWDKLLDDLLDCLDAQSIKRLLKLKASGKLQVKVSRLAEKCTEGKLTAKERDEYGAYVSFGTLVAILKSKARRRYRRAKLDEVS